LTRVKNERDGQVMAPKRNEFEQARRLGVDIRAVRQTIRDCFEHSNNGRSFEAALAERGFILAKGDRRDFVVIDHEGGMHALGKRILGVTAGQARDRLSDLSREQLPTVEQAREKIERARSGERDQIAWEDQLAAAAIAKEKIEGRFAEPATARSDGEARPQRMPNADRDEIAWQDALAKAAIEKEKIQRRFVESAQGPKPASAERELTGTIADIRLTAALTDAGPSFAAALRDRGLMLARVTAEDIVLRDLNKRAQDRAQVDALVKARDWKAQNAGFDALESEQRLEAQAAFDRWTERQPQDKRWDVSAYVGYVQHRFAEQRDRVNAMDLEPQPTPEVAALAGLSRRVHEGDLVVVNRWGTVFSLTPESTGKSWDEMRGFMAGIPPHTLHSVATAQHLQEEVRAARRPQAELSEVAADIRLARSFSDTPQAFMDALSERGLWLAVVTEAEATRSQNARQALDERGEGTKVWNQHGNREYLNSFSPRHEEGEFVAIDTVGHVYGLNLHTTGHSHDEMQAFLGTLDATQFKGIDATRGDFLPDRKDRHASTEDTRGVQGEALSIAPRDSSLVPRAAPIAGKVLGAGAHLAEAGIEMLASIFDPPSRPTPQQLQARAEAQEERQERLQFDVRRYIEDRDFRARFDAQERERREAEALERAEQRRRSERER
jgi:hypothetical protein